MNWEQIEGKWAQVSGQARTTWARLTDDDLLLLKGKKDVFLGALQERMGLAKDAAEKELDALIAKLDP